MSAIAICWPALLLGFNPGHALGIFILVLLVMVYLAMKTQTFGRFSAYVETF